MKIEEIILEFEREFFPIKTKFEVIRVLKGGNNFTEEKIRNAVHYIKTDEDKEYNMIWHPGVYLFFGDGKPYRIGRHLENARQRAIEHFRDNTTNSETKDSIFDLKRFRDTELILFSLKNRYDAHWAAAVEIYLERKFKEDLKIPAKREG